MLNNNCTFGRAHEHRGGWVLKWNKGTWHVHLGLWHARTLSKFSLRMRLIVGARDILSEVLIGAATTRNTSVHQAVLSRVACCACVQSPLSCSVCPKDASSRPQCTFSSWLLNFSFTSRRQDPKTLRSIGGKNKQKVDSLLKMQRTVRFLWTSPFAPWSFAICKREKQHDDQADGMFVHIFYEETPRN